MTQDKWLPPQYCEYADGPCDQDFSGLSRCDGFFIFPSSPTNIASTIETTVERLKSRDPERIWKSWTELDIPGKIIFCTICKRLRSSNTVFADVTTLNFNVLFEIGFAVGLRVPVIPIRDTSYEINKREFNELGVLDILGYLDFKNSEELADKILDYFPGSEVTFQKQEVARQTPLYVLKGPIETEGAVKLMSTLEKSGLKFRTYYPVELPRLPLYDALKQISKSVGVVANLLSPNRKGAKVHNALCSFYAVLGWLI